MNQAGQGEDAATSCVVRIMFGIVAVFSVLAMGILAGIAISYGDVVAAALQEKKLALMAVPIAASFATALVAGLRAIDGELTFELLGIKASRAGAMVVGWLVIFTAIVMAAYALR